MALPTTYSTGTATVNNNETAVNGQGTTWLTSGLQAGDLFWAGGMSVRIASVNSNTSLTLAFPWPGASRAAQQYEVRFTPDATRVLASARAVLDAIAGGNIKAFGDLASAADKLGYFTGAGTMGLADFKAGGRQIAGAVSLPAVRDLLGVPIGDWISNIGLIGNNVNLPYMRKDDDEVVIDLQTRLAVAPGSLKVNGYHLQWGSRVVDAASDGLTNIVLPQAMGSAEYYPLVSNGASFIDVYPSTNLGSQTTTQFEVTVRNAAGGYHAGVARINFMAFGLV